MMCAGVTKSGSPTSRRITSGTARARSAMTRIPECGVVVMACETSGIAEQALPWNRRRDQDMLLDDPEGSSRLGVVGDVRPGDLDFRRGHGLLEGGFVIEPLLDERVRAQSSARPADDL